MAASVAAVVQLPQLSHAHPGVRWSIGLNFGYPGYYHRPWYGYGWAPYYAPAPIIYEAAPAVVVRPAPIIVRSEPAPVVVRSEPPVITETAPPPPPSPAPVVRAVSEAAPSSRATSLLGQLHDAKESVRRDAAMDLGRMKASQAIDPLVTILAKDSSPIVRDAAARALGLIGAQRTLNALIYAAQADTDRDVRHSAQFAVEIIRSNLRGN
jgi:hypothetical protein